MSREDRFKIIVPHDIFLCIVFNSVQNCSHLCYRDHCWETTPIKENSFSEDVQRRIAPRHDPQKVGKEENVPRVERNRHRNPDGYKQRHYGSCTMRLAIISDIHGNLEAFTQVLEDIDRSGIDGIMCLGDSVGYGPDPEEVIKLIRKRNIPSVMGNHELGITDETCFDWFNSSAQESLLITRELISTDTFNYIKKLPPSLVFEGSLCVHGCPPDSMTTYLFELFTSQLREIFLKMRNRMCFVGHTHDLEIISFNGKEVDIARLPQGLVELKKGRQYIVNIGSVGQPRDGDNRAKYVIWDVLSNNIEVRFIPYDIAVTAHKIMELGFPEIYAQRLW